MASTTVRPFSIREASERDLERLCELAAELLSKIHAEGNIGDARRVFERIIKTPDFGKVLVAEHKAGLCGYAYAAYEWRSEFGGETMEIVALWVEEQWRSKGVGGRLVNALLQHARERGIRRVAAQVHPGNSAIERTLEAAGFDPERRTLWGMRL